MKRHVGRACECSARCIGRFQRRVSPYSREKERIAWQQFTPPCSSSRFSFLCFFFLLFFVLFFVFFHRDIKAPPPLYAVLAPLVHRRTYGRATSPRAAISSRILLEHEITAAAFHVATQNFRKTVASAMRRILWSDLYFIDAYNTYRAYMCDTHCARPPRSQVIYSYREWPSFSRLHDNHGAQIAKAGRFICFARPNSRDAHLFGRFNSNVPR